MYNIKFKMLLNYYKLKLLFKITIGLIDSNFDNKLSYSYNLLIEEPLSFVSDIILVTKYILLSNNIIRNNKIDYLIIKNIDELENHKFVFMSKKNI